MEGYYEEDFTLSNYERVIQKAKEKYVFLGFKEFATRHKNVVLLRHDIDFSINKAIALAEIENYIGVKATYFFHLHSNSYNFFDVKNIEMARRIVSLGHDIGLHVDFEFYNLYKNHIVAEEYFNQEILALEDILESEVSACSFHNPEYNSVLDLDDERFCNKVNVYSKFISERYKYCSDSNGYWRFERLEDVLSSGYEYLQILIHPVWWDEKIITPAERMYEMLISSSYEMYQDYSKLLSVAGRKNVGNEKVKW